MGAVAVPKIGRGREREKEEKGGKKEKREEKEKRGEKGKKGRGEQDRKMNYGCKNTPLELSKDYKRHKKMGAEKKT